MSKSKKVTKLRAARTGKKRAGATDTRRRVPAKVKDGVRFESKGRYLSQFKTVGGRTYTRALCTCRSVAIAREMAKRFDRSHRAFAA